MADIDFDEYGGAPRFSGDQAKRLVNIAGAACSVALLIGMGVWGYRLAVRDVSGIPVIKAAEGPMRVAPVDPGGEIADHQGMAVNAIPELRPVDRLPAELILAPPPVVLYEEDTPGVVSVISDQTAQLPQDPPKALPLEAMIAQEAEMQAASPIVTTQDAVAMALAEALGQEQPLVASSQSGDEAKVMSEPVAEGDLVRSPRPRMRPGNGALSDVQAVAASPAPMAAEIDPATLSPGTRLVQLGAFDTADQARGEWAVLTQRFGDLMSGKSVVVQTAESGGRTFYRLRAHGFDGEDDARRFCAALLAENAACIPVAHR